MYFEQQFLKVKVFVFFSSYNLLYNGFLLLTANTRDKSIYRITGVCLCTTCMYVVQYTCMMYVSEHSYEMYCCVPL